MSNKVKLFLFVLISSVSVLYAQDCSWTNSSFEYYSGCPTDSFPSHSQFTNLTNVWINALSNSTSTPDIFVKNAGTCSFTEFSASGVTVKLDTSKRFTGCAWAGLFLNYNDGFQDARYREYIMQKVDIIAGRTYTINIDMAKSSHASSDNLEVDFAIYGYNGPVPAAQQFYCLLDGGGSAVPILATIDKTVITSSIQTFTVSFTPTANFQYLAFGGADCSIFASDIGYVFFDDITLSDNTNSVLNPIIVQSVGAKQFETNTCCYSGVKEDFFLDGNAITSGATALWSQSASNPEILTFLTPNDTITSIAGSGIFTTRIV